MPSNPRMFMSNTPRKLSGLRLLGSNPSGKMVFLDPDSGSWAYLSPRYGLLLSLCDGQHTLKDLSTLFGGLGSKEKRLTTVQRMVEHLLDVGMIEGSVKPIADLPSRHVSKIVYRVTQACNLTCSYCFVKAGARDPYELTTRESLNLMEDFAAIGIEWLGFSGGEPLLRPDIFDIAAAARSHGIITALASNGVLIDRGKARKISRLFSEVQISLDGFRQENDHFRGSGSFDQIIKGLEHLRNAGVEFTISCTVSSVNIGKLEEFLRFLVDLGVKGFCAVRLYRIGRAVDKNIPELNKKDYLEKLMFIAKQWSGKIAVHQSEGLFQRGGAPQANCGQCFDTLQIAPAGEVYPNCAAYIDRQPPLGAIRQQKLSDIISESSELRAIRSWSVLDDPVCRQCDFRNICGGRCVGDPLKSPETCENARLYKWLFLEREQTGGEELLYH